jgi:hypothetical protein
MIPSFAKDLLRSGPPEPEKSPELLFVEKLARDLDVELTWHNGHAKVPREIGRVISDVTSKLNAMKNRIREADELEHATELVFHRFFKSLPFSPFFMMGRGFRRGDWGG